MEPEEDFERQIALEEKEKEKEALGYYYTDPNDGTVYEWDPDKRAWFPKLNDDFLAAYHASYGVESGTDTVSTETKPDVPPNKPDLPSTQPEPQQPQQTDGQKKRKAEEGWFQVGDRENTKVYVSGLPDDITLEEFKEMMSKCGIIMVDEETEEPKIKLYKDSEGNPKGDGLCSYLKRESVDLAIQILDDTEVRGRTISVQQAQFSLKGEYNPSWKKKKKKKDKKKKGSVQERLLSWKPEKKFDQKKRYEYVVIIKNMFHPSEFDEDATLITDLRDDLMAECSKFGEVAKVMIFDNHPEGVTSVKFKDADNAEKCVAAMNGRWFAKRQLRAEIWDGKTDYKVEETDQEREARLAKWEEFLSAGEGTKDAGKSSEESSSHVRSSEGQGSEKVKQEPELPQSENR